GPCVSAPSPAATVTVNPLPVATITPSPTASFCIGGSVLLTGNAGVGLTYQWYLNAGIIPGATSSTYTATAAGSYTLVVTVTATGCVKTSAATVVTVNPLPPVSISPATATICAGQNIALTAGGASTYSWSPATGLSATTGA